MHANIDCCRNGPSRISGAGPRFPDLKNRYRVSWRDAWYGLLAPAIRLHRYRELQSEMLEEAMRRDDDREACR